MKKILSMILIAICIFGFVACSNSDKKDIELMGAGERIHDTFTFANRGVSITEKENNVYEISGEVDKINDDKIKQEFEIDNDIDYVVAIKLSANGREIKEDKLKIEIDGIRAYDAEHLNGKDYTYILLEAVANANVSISVKWDGEQENKYIIQFSENLILK